MKKKIKWIGLGVLLFFVLCLAFQQVQISSAIHKNLLGFLTSASDPPVQKVFDAIYVLGGDQESLRSKFKILSALYSQGRCKEIVILSRPGTTEYNTSLKRNMTNDEWSLMILDNFRIPEKDIQMLQIKSGFFGTYSEAKFVSQMAEEKSWKSLLLITSPHHTRRVIESFTRLICTKMLDVDVWVTASNEKTGLLELFLELFKLKVYQLFLLT